MTAVPSDPPVTRIAPHRTVTAGRARSIAAAARRPSTTALLHAVEAAITRLDGLAGAFDHATRTALDRRLREALTRHIGRTGENGPAVPAVRVACAHLAAGDLEWAYLSLLTARDQLE
ncbi:hypothetical protein EV188_106160 [Actinomycetospora succinea]|uniref:Uncharacterized protein n=1 Tax=Actinomycetospora succinea TaxID=663603 RepID=A0A4R6V1N8_9PSEU|nr:hypothetical protein [Actinomycetospora succinea]TDQ54014.1 hypothetical protein EV188_106160 [Actinomycetospora succinea]